MVSEGSTSRVMVFPVSLDKDLHSSPESEDQMKSGLFLDVVIRQGPAIFELFSSKDQSLLVWGDSLFILDLSLDIFNGVRRFHLQSDGLSSKSFDENLHSSSKSEDQVKSRLFLDVVVGQGPSIFQLFPGKDQPLLVWGDSLLVLDLGLDILNGVGRFHLQGDRLSSECLDKDLHSSPESEDQMEGGLFLDVIVGQGASVFQLFPSKDQPLLVWGDSLLVLDLRLDILDGIRRLNL